ncbi:MAG TPA: ROK family protein, partial [Erysipelothrix sp.]|nr:ROK family protein [Erysipelothrix sp.]
SGRYGYAGEIANIIVDRNRPKLNHLNPGAVENWASGTAIVQQAQQEISSDIESALTVFNLANEGNTKAQKIIDDMVIDFASMLSTIAHVVEPYMFVIGGGVSKSHKFYLDRVIEEFKNRVHPGMRHTKFELAKLEEPGVIGAAMLCTMNQE